MLKFNGKNLDEFNIIVTNGMSFTSAAQDIELKEVSGIDGDIAISNKRLKGFDRSFPFAILSKETIETDFQNLSSFLKKDDKWHELEWSGNPDYIYKAMYIEEINIEMIVKKYGKGVLNFRFKPVKYLKSGLTEMALGNSINNPTLRPAKPRIEIKGSGSITVKFGQSELKLTAVDGGVIVDSQSQTITDLTGQRPQFNKMLSYPFPEILPGNQVVTKTGNISSIKIIPRWEVVAT